MNTLQLFSMILGCAFFFGMLFRTVITFSVIVSEVINQEVAPEILPPAGERLLLGENNLLANSTSENTDDNQYPNFIDEYQLYDKTKLEDITIFIYYSFTTLSTVGFGDYHPKSNTERIFVAFFMLFGVMIFSYIMGNFIEMLHNFQGQYGDNEDISDLTRFLAFIQKLNFGDPQKDDFQNQVMRFFEYKWRSDSNMQFHNEDFKYLVKVMPISKKIEMFRSYLFFMFCYKYQKYFMFEKEPFEQQQTKRMRHSDKRIRIMHAHFNW